MPYDQDLASRIRKILGDAPGLTEKEMFGGVGSLPRAALFSQCRRWWWMLCSGWCISRNPADFGLTPL